MRETLLQAGWKELIQNQRWEELRARLATLHFSDIAEIIIELPPEDEGIIFRVLPRDHAAQVLSYLPPDQQEELIRSLSRQRGDC